MLPDIKHMDKISTNETLPVDPGERIRLRCLKGFYPLGSLECTANGTFIYNSSQGVCVKNQNKESKVGSRNEQVYTPKDTTAGTVLGVIILVVAAVIALLIILMIKKLNDSSHSDSAYDDSTQTSPTAVTQI